MKYCTNQDINQLVKGLIRQGWCFCWGSKHGRLSSPDGRAKLSVPSTPSDHRAFLNFRRDVRHAIST